MENDKISTDAIRPLEKMMQKEVVDAVLRSKSPRGQKRDNPGNSDNGNHAGSTRFQKKQRYQELVNCEEKLLDMQNVEALNLRRVRCVIDYICARETMLRNTLDGATIRNQVSNQMAERREIGHRYDADSEENHREHPQRLLRLVSFNDLSCQGDSFDEEFPVVLKALVDNSEDFGFDIVGQPVDQMDQSGFTAVAKMKNFDSKVGGYLYRSYGQEGVRGLRYEIVGSDNGVALNEDGTGFAKVNIIVNLTEQQVTKAREADEGENATKSKSVTILSAIASLRFAPQTDKLRSVEFCVLKNFTNTLP